MTVNLFVVNTKNEPIPTDYKSIRRYLGLSLHTQGRRVSAKFSSGKLKLNNYNIEFFHMADENDELRRLCSCAKQYNLSMTLRRMIDAVLKRDKP